MSVLIVDDDKLVREMLGRFCVSCNIEHSLASSTAEAVSLCEKENFEVVITDFLMPGESGIELAKKVKNIRPETKVFVFTGSCPYGLPENLQVYFDKVFEKPGDTSRMIAEIVQAVAKGKI